MIVYIVSTIVIAGAAFYAGAKYGIALEQKAVAELVKAEQYGANLYQGIVTDIKRRVAKYL